MAKCYDRNGNQDVAHIPCSQDGDPAQCCDEGAFCASNGLCVKQEDNEVSYWQNTCSDPDWADGSISTCPTQCIDINNGGNGITACGNSTWCCYGYGGCDCNNSTQVFSLAPVRIIATATPFTSTTTTTTRTTTSSTSSTSTSDPTSSTPSPTNTGSSDDSSSSSHLGVGVGVGLGVGIPLVVGALVAFWFFRRRKARSTAGPSAAPLVEHYQPGLMDKARAQEVGGPQYQNQGHLSELPTRPTGPEQGHLVELQ